ELSLQKRTKQMAINQTCWFPFNATRRAFVATPLVILCLGAFGCSRSSKDKVEVAPSTQTVAPSPQTVEAKQQQMAKLPPPVLDHVQLAVKRIFNDSVVVDVEQQPNFIAGDFNGDLSQDLAVIIKPVPGKLGELNEEFPKWLLRDPFRPSEPGTPPLRVTE